MICLRDVINRELGKTSNAPRGIRGTIHQVRLLRQLNERSALARSLLETALQTHPDDATAQREWGALLLFSSETPADRASLWKRSNWQREAQTQTPERRSFWRSRLGTRECSIGWRSRQKTSYFVLRLWFARYWLPVVEGRPSAVSGESARPVMRRGRIVAAARPATFVADLTYRILSLSHSPSSSRYCGKDLSRSFHS